MTDLGHFMARWYPRIRHDLASSDSETIALTDLLAMADEEDTARWDTLRLGYGTPRGADWLRRTIAARYAACTAEDVMCFAGAQEGLACVLHALHAAGDHAIHVVPAYQPAGAVLRSLYDVTEVAQDAARGWDLDIGAIAGAMRPSTRLVLMNFPNNPTGKIMPPADFSALVTLCRQRGVWLINDEVYRLIDHAGAPRLPTAVDCYERGISIDSLSKSYGLPGLRTGWIAVRDTALLERAESVKHEFSGCLAGSSEVLATIAVKASARILDRNRRIAAGNLLRLADFLAAFPDLFDWHPPDGGVVGYIRYRGAGGVEAFATALARDAGVLVLPGSIWHLPGSGASGGRFRLGFGHAGLDRGLAAMTDFLRREPARSRNRALAT